MVLSQEELMLAQNVLIGLQNATGYSYEIIVRGTAVVAILNVITILTTVILGLIGAIFSYRYIINSKKNGTYEKYETPNEWWMAIIGFIVIGLITLIIMILLTSSIQGYLIPEYTVMNRVLDIVTVR